ncbi:MAG TPA: hypothetical protein VIY54_08390 [Steroidobacteraceae bacterium]
MRFAARGPGASRQERADRLRRERAAALTLRASFPAVQQLRLELRFEGTANPPTSQAHVLHPPARAYFEFPCPYADCDGQFDLDSAVNGALAVPAHQAEGHLGCSGSRIRDHSSKQPCQLQLAYKITAMFAGEG